MDFSVIGHVGGTCGVGAADGFYAIPLKQKDGFNTPRRRPVAGDPVWMGHRRFCPVANRGGVKVNSWRWMGWDFA